MKILAIVPSLYDTTPGQRFRIEQWEPYLAEAGIEITYAPFETPELKTILYNAGNVIGKMSAVAGGIWRRRADVTKARSFDLIYLFREAALLGPAWFERRLAATGVPIIFDFDDAVFESYKSPSNGYLSYLKFPGKTASTIRRAAHVMAGNPYLAEYSRKFNENVTVIPTTIDTDKYTFRDRSEASELVTIGWSGSYSTVQHLDTVRGALQKLAEHHQFRLRVIGTPEYQLEGVKTESLPWRSETEIDDLRLIDIGIMPLPDDKWSKGKCGLKALQYMALGKPTVCSSVGVNSVIIQDGINGLIADTEAQWIEKLAGLIMDRALQDRLGRKGRDTVERSYSARSIVPRLVELFESVVRSRKAP